MRFVDEAKITIRSGKGGNGCVSFRREKFVPKGGPDGGNGGRGGDVIFRAETRLLTLYDFRLKRVYEAENGQPGQGRQKYGRNGQDLVVDVPVGTLVYAVGEDGPEPELGDVDESAARAPGPEPQQGDLGEPVPAEPDVAVEYVGGPPRSAQGGEDEAEDDGRPWRPAGPPPGREELLADLDEAGKTVVVAQGGRGGKGNEHFKSSTMRTPRFAQPGEPGQELRVRLVLKIMADCGLLGLPNAGKSTLIAAVSAARPKIAAYPFTTVAPNLGVVMGDSGERMVVADIPGLIEGAHQGHGLGHRFLKHVERTRFLVHLLSAEDMDADNPWAGFDLVNEELRRFDPALARKPQLEVVNKIDLLPPEALEAVQARAREEDRRVFFISALQQRGLDRLLAAMWRRYRAGASE
jgi:GTP-binding protein